MPVKTAPIPSGTQDWWIRLTHEMGKNGDLRPSRESSRPAGGLVEPSFCGLRFVHVPWQEWLNVAGSFATGVGAAVQEPPQPGSWVDVPLLQGGEHGKQRHRQRSAPLGIRAVVILAAQRRTAQAAFRGVVVHRNARVVHEAVRPVQCSCRLYQNLATRLTQLRVGKLCRGRWSSSDP